MRSEQEMMGLILGTAEKDGRVRAVWMNGSRANPNAPKDIFQDYDIVYLVTETGSFLRDWEWIRVFGDPVIIQLPDELDKIAGKETHFDRCYGYLMQFMDGNRIDLHIETKEEALKEFGTDSQTVTLLDKDGVLPKLPPPSDRSYRIERPEPELFYRCCNEFWWVVLYVGKGLWRGEVPYAMDCLNSYVRPQLVAMLSWYAGIRTDFSVSAGKSGKYLSRFLPPETWDRFLHTWSGPEIPEIWESVFRMCGLFGEAARAVASRFSFAYPEDEARRSFDYLRHIRDLPGDAREIR